MIVSPVTAAALYLTDMVSDHTSFENYVNQRDEYSYCDIPSYIDYDYYTNINLNTLIDNIASNSFEYYEQARGNNSEKYVAMVNTLPYAKEVVAGLLYRFADEMYESHTHKYTSIWTGQNYHSGDRHYYQSVEECTICGHYGSYEWISYFCPGPPCLGVLSNEK